MENTKIFIDVDDEITFIAERVLNARTQNIILVAPEKASLLSSLASLKLLSHEVEKTGKKVVVVTMDETGKLLSEKAGFKTRNRVGEVDAGIWDEFVKETPSFKIPQIENVAQTDQEDNPTFVDEVLHVNKEEASLPEAFDSEIPMREIHEEDIESVEEVMQEALIDAAEEDAELENSSFSSMRDVLASEDFAKEENENPEISLEDIKTKNPSVFEIPSIPKLQEDQDVVKMAQTEPAKPRYVESVRIVKLDGFDLVVGGDAAVIKKSKEIERKVIAKKADTINSIIESNESEGGSIIGHDIEVPAPKKKVSKLPIIHNNPIMEKIQEMRKKHGKKFRPWMSVPLIVILLGGFVGWYMLLSKAVVAVGVTSNNLSETATVTANINNSSVDVANNAVPAYIRDVNESSSSSLNTTGTKQVGTNATGPITIYSTSSTSVTIPKGTVFVTNDNNAYQYTLDTDASIPAANGSPQSVTDTLTAQTFGAQYNIPKGVAFNIQDSNIQTQQFLASSTNAFTGGSSSTAQVVAQADQDNLLKSLENQLNQKGHDEISTKIGSNEVEVKDSLKDEDVTKAFDSNVGDKAPILNLSLTTKTSVLVYSNDDLQKFTNGFLSKDLKSDEQLSDVKYTATQKSYDSGSNTVTINISMSAVAVPQLNTTNISTLIKGKTEGSATSYISSLNGVKSVSISVSPFWAGWLHMLPTRGSNISYKINHI